MLTDLKFAFKTVCYWVSDHWLLGFSTWLYHTIMYSSRMCTTHSLPCGGSPWQRPMDRYPPGQRPPGQRALWTETPHWTEIPGQRSPQTETLVDGNPTGMETHLDRDQDSPLLTENTCENITFANFILRVVKMTIYYETFLKDMIDYVITEIVNKTMAYGPFILVIY